MCSRTARFPPLVPLPAHLPPFDAYAAHLQGGRCAARQNLPSCPPSAHQTARECPGMRSCRLRPCKCLNHQKAAAERGPRPLVAKLRRRGAGAPPPHVRQFATLMRQPCPSQASAQQMHAGRSAATSDSTALVGGTQGGDEVEQRRRGEPRAAAQRNCHRTTHAAVAAAHRQARPRAGGRAVASGAPLYGTNSARGHVPASQRSPHLRLVHSPQWLSALPAVAGKPGGYLVVRPWQGCAAAAAVAPGAGTALREADGISSAGDGACASAGGTHAAAASTCGATPDSQTAAWLPRRRGAVQPRASQAAEDERPPGGGCWHAVQGMRAGDPEVGTCRAATCCAGPPAAPLTACCACCAPFADLSAPAATPCCAPRDPSSVHLPSLTLRPRSVQHAPGMGGGWTRPPFTQTLALHALAPPPPPSVAVSTPFVTFPHKPLQVHPHHPSLRLPHCVCTYFFSQLLISTRLKKSGVRTHTSA